ncbi:MAG: glycogen-binding domain-containing protein [Bacteroidales bacterium]
MRTCFTWISLFIFVFSTLDSRAQFDTKTVCRFENGRLIFKLDRRWTASQRKQVVAAYDLDSVLMAWAMNGNPKITQNGITWTTRKLDADHIELSKDNNQSSGKEVDIGKIMLVDDQWIKFEASEELESDLYGVNRLTRNTVINLNQNRVRIFLPGYNTAKKIFISGSFNDWSTTGNPLQKCDSGWTTTLTLIPGKYSYKFITDGKWTNDPYNKLREDDANGGYNNLFFCYNYKFALNGYPKARKVVLTGSFNEWNENELRMIRFHGSWILPLYLKEGTHAYKFIVDDTWITDPANKITRPDGTGHFNSFMGIGDTLFFRLKGYPDAKTIVVAGNFNVWNTGELFMVKTADGWQLPYVLDAGNYEYKYVVDGEWITDPGNPYSAGSGPTCNSFLTVKPNYTFRLEQHSDASNVFLTGSFNGWNPNGYRMIKKEGTWLFPLYLRPGKYTYKFIVDDQWILDPSNELWEDNEYGTGNSVLWIAP